MGNNKQFTKAFGIWGNTDKEKFWDYLNPILEWAKNQNIEPYITTRIRENLPNSFDKKAKEICASNSNGNFDILERKVEVLEYDETPAWGTEEKILVGIDGLVECK